MSWENIWGSERKTRSGLWELRKWESECMLRVRPSIFQERDSSDCGPTVIREVGVLLWFPVGGRLGIEIWGILGVDIRGMLARP